MFHLDFDDPKLQILCHDSQSHLIPRLSKELAPYALEHHFVLFSSGTTGGDLKGFAISKEALFTNANAVNKHFKLTRQDVWGLSLPLYHVGGLSVPIRADLLGNKIIDARSWDPENWAKKMKDVTITSVVPTQLYDLVKLNLRPSPALRYLIVGGDLLSARLKEKALELGWPVIRTFGMSEVSSQLASSDTPSSDELKILPIHQAKTDKNQRLMVKSESLFTLQFSIGEEFKLRFAKDLCDQDGLYLTQDRAIVEGNVIKHLGRLGEEFKISGHLINLNSLKETLLSYLAENNLYGQMELILENDERKGKKLTLLYLPGTLTPFHNEKIQSLLRPVKIDRYLEVSSFNRTALGKLRSIMDKDQ